MHLLFLLAMIFIYGTAPIRYIPHLRLFNQCPVLLCHQLLRHRSYGFDSIMAPLLYDPKLHLQLKCYWKTQFDLKLLFRSHSTFLLLFIQKFECSAAEYYSGWGSECGGIVQGLLSWCLESELIDFYTWRDRGKGTVLEELGEGTLIVLS